MSQKQVKKTKDKHLIFRLTRASDKKVVTQTL